MRRLLAGRLTSQIQTHRVALHFPFIGFHRPSPLIGSHERFMTRRPLRKKVGIPREPVTGITLMSSSRSASTG